MKLLILFTFCICVFAQSGLDIPSLGKMLDANGSVRSVYGIAANVTLGDPETSGVLSMACSQKFCLAKTDSSILSTQGSVDAPAGPALFAFDGDAAFVWMVQSRQLARWHDNVLDWMDSNVEGEVLSLRAHQESVEFAVRRSTGTWIVAMNGTVTGVLPRAIGPVLLLAQGAIYSTREEIVIRDEVVLPVRGARSFLQMGDGYVQVHTESADYAVRLERGRETVFQLPGMN